jgi:hypothetical protein
MTFEEQNKLEAEGWEWLSNFLNKEEIDTAFEENFLLVDIDGDTRHVCSEECRDDLIEEAELRHIEREMDYEDSMFDCGFADPGGRSALRAGERVYPCPTCERPNQLCAEDVQLGYQCDYCADLLERGGY